VEEGTVEREPVAAEQEPVAGLQEAARAVVAAALAGREARALGARVAVRAPTADSERAWDPGAIPGIRGT
jgi:hypothetical protein